MRQSTCVPVLHATFVLALGSTIALSTSNAEEPIELEAPAESTLPNDTEKEQEKPYESIYLGSFPSIAEAAPQASLEYADLYTPYEFVPSEPSDAENQQKYRYRLYEPPNLIDGEDAAMFVWLHGLQEYGSNNFSQLRWLPNMMGFDADGLKKRKMYVLTMQCPKGTSWGGENEVVLKAIIDKTIETCPVDRDRIYLSGISAGGSGCWTMAIRYPETFAGVLSLSGVGGSISDMNRIKNVPIWAIYKAFDGIEPVRKRVNALKAVGGRVHLTEQKGMGHIVNISRYKGLLDWWLFSQKRGLPASYRPPGILESTKDQVDVQEKSEDSKEWQPYQLALQIGLPLLVLLACFQEIRRRNRAGSKASAKQDKSSAAISASLDS